MEHQHDSQKMICTGMAPSLAADLRANNGKFRFLQNARIREEGAIESRPSIDKIIDLDPAILSVPHTIKTIVDKITGGIRRIAGIGTDIYTGNGVTVTQKVGGFSGDPLSIVDFRPEEAIETYAYIADRLKMCKISVSDTVSDIGINVPTKALSFKLLKPIRKIINNITAADIGDWNNLVGSAGIPTIENRINATIDAILYDEAAPSFASIVPDVMPPTLQTGSIITLNGVDEVIAEEIIPSSLLSGAAMIDTIQYDIGSSGLCTIVLSIPDISIRRNSILLINAAEYVRVLEVTRNINNLPSIRTTTTSTHISGESVSGVASIRLYANNIYAIGHTILAEGAISAIGTTGVSSITNPIDIDLTNADGRALKNDDYIHCSIKVSDPLVLNEIQVQFDCDSVTPFNNRFYYPISPNFFTSSAAQSGSTLSTIQETLQREELVSKLLELQDQPTFDGGYTTRDLGLDPIDYLPISNPIGQTALGENQWVEFYIKLKDLKRVGTDSSRTRKDIKAIRLSVNCTAAITVGIDSIWVGGASDLESNIGNNLAPYNYIFRVRDPRTKAISNWSPPLREAIFVSRNTISLTIPPDIAALYPANYMFDIARFGGSLKDYRIVGTIKNDGSIFEDTVSDLVAANNAPAGRRLKGDQIGDEEVFDFYKPFTFFDTPKLGTCNVIGTKLTIVSGDNLNVTYPRGVAILVNGIHNRFYTNPTDITHVELEKDMGSLSGVPFEIKTPLLTGQPLPIIFGTFGEGNAGLFVFGLGNNKAAGTLYWLDGNSPDTQSDINFLEITSPSEPLLAGVMYDSYGFVFTNERSFAVYPTFLNGPLGFIARESANSRGIFSRWSICAGRNFIYYLTENADGIVRVPGGGNPQSITNATLFNLFPRNGIAAQPIEIIIGGETITILPPDFTKINDIRLFHCRDFVKFRFVDIAGDSVCLVFDERINDWISYDTYPDGKANAFYAEEIESTSTILVGIENGIGAFVDAVSAREQDLKTIVVPFSADQGDSRILKRYDEIVFDAVFGDLAGEGINYTVFYNNGIEAEAPANLTTTGFLRLKAAKAINAGVGTLARNISCKTEWKFKANVKLFEQIYYLIPRADQINNRASDLENAGVFGDKFWQGVVIEADTFGVTKRLIFKDEDNTIREIIEINHLGKSTKSYSFDVPWISHGIIQTSVDDVEWIHYNSQYKFDIEPELGKVWETQETSHGIPGFKVIERIGIVARTTTAATLRIFYDGVEEAYSLNNTAGDKEKQFFFVRARKAKLLKYRVDSEQDMRNYLEDLEIWIRQYNSQGFYQVIKPFGAKDAQTGAQI